MVMENLLVIPLAHIWAYRRFQRLAGVYLAGGVLTKLRRMLQGLNGLYIRNGNFGYDNKDPGGS